MVKKLSPKIFLWTALVVVVLIALLVVFSKVIIQDISEVKNEENIGEKVIVRGEVKTVIKIGGLSGYTLEDETGTIGVSSDDLPVEGEKITVRGTLMRDTIFGYYVKVSP